MTVKHVFFRVEGQPIPEGSMKAFRHPGRFASIVPANQKDLLHWRRAVAYAASEAWQEGFERPVPTTRPAEVHATFWFRRPKGHFGTGRNRATLKPSAPRRHTVKPDTDKLQRAIGDALTGIVLVDDSQIYAWARPEKFWLPQPDDEPYAEIAVVFDDP